MRQLSLLFLLLFTITNSFCQGKKVVLEEVVVKEKAIPEITISGTRYSYKERDLKKELKVRRFEDRRRVIEKYVEGVYVKHLNGSGKVKEYEIKIKLFYDGEDGRDGLFKMIYNTINNSFYIPKTNLAETLILDYNHLSKFSLILTYNYKTFTSGRTNKNKRKLTRVDLPSYIRF